MNIKKIYKSSASKRQGASVPYFRWCTSYTRYSFLKHANCALPRAISYIKTSIQNRKVLFQVRFNRTTKRILTATCSRKSVSATCRSGGHYSEVIKSLFFTAACVFLLSACTHFSAYTGAQKNVEASKTVYAMDTVMTLSAYGSAAEKAAEEAEKEIFRLDSLFRRKSEDSEVYKINKQGEAEVSKDTAKLIKEALDICSETDGAFDISIAPVMDLWGFYTKEFYVPSEKELSAALSRVNYRNITVNGKYISANRSSFANRNSSVNENSELDLGGIAKGYLSEKIIEIFRENGIKSGLISLGGNVQTLGKKPDGSLWRVAIQNPDDADKYSGVLSVFDKAVVTSGGYQRFFEQDGSIYHHIIDPKTGAPSKSGLKSVSVISGSGTLADGLSTALFVMGLDKASDYWKNHSGFDAVFITDENEIYITQGLEDIFESDYSYSVISK